MMKDRGQKAEALRYAVGRRWFPQLEVVVNPTTPTSTRDYNITDVDLLAFAPGPLGGYQQVIFDCKSSSKIAAASRTLWLRGVMDQIGADHGVCVLGRERRIEVDHRLQAASLKITLLSESEFPQFAVATDGRLDSGISHAADIELWELLSLLPTSYPKLSEAERFRATRFWALSSESAACRGTVAAVMANRGELDPAKSAHRALFGDLLALFLHAVGRLTDRIYRSYLLSSSREELSRSLLYLIYGGRDRYQLFDELRRLASTASSSLGAQTSLSLPNWHEFVGLVRALMDAPRQALDAPLLAREVAFSHLAKSRDLSFAERLAAERPYAAKFALLGARYLVQAARLPPEFGNDAQETFLAIQSPSPARPEKP